VLYVENLIGAETVNTLPPDTINAFRDHGKIPGMTVREGLEEADDALARLARVGIDLEMITERLQKDGVESFATSFDQLMAALEKKRAVVVGHAVKKGYRLWRATRNCTLPMDLAPPKDRTPACW
jgi:hypothetical protein